MLEGLSRIYDLTSPYASEAKSNEDGSIMSLGHMGLCSEPDDPLWDLLGMTKAPAPTLPLGMTNAHACKRVRM